MASLKLLLGMVPPTSKIEQAEKDLITEYEKLKVFTESDQLARFNELNELVNSPDFINKKKEIESLRYKDSEEYAREKEFLSLKKAKDIVLYFKTSSGEKLKSFKEMESSGKINDFEALESIIQSQEFREKQKMKPVTFKDTGEYKKLLEHKELKSDPEVKSYLKSDGKGEEKSKTVLRYEELDKVVNSSEFIEKKNMKPVTFKDTDEYKKLLEYKELKGSSDIKGFYKFKSSKEYKNYLNTEGSDRLARYEELKEYVASSEFTEKKEYLLDRKRFEKSEMFRQLQEYEQLKKSDDIIWYFKTKDSDKFDLLKNRKLTFSDEFDTDKLDTKTWLTNYYWGEKLLKDRYSLESDLHAYTEKENFEINNSILKIITKPQKTTGKVWSETKGFSTREFDYTSGLINTGESFRQLYGIFTAKVKLGDPYASNAFWMLSDRITPHIDICRTSNGKVLFDYFPDKGSAAKSSLGSKYSKDFYIYTLEWTSEKLVWKINDIEITRVTANIPQEPMYILFTGGLNKPINGITSTEIDWVRVYQPV